MSILSERSSDGIPAPGGRCLPGDAGDGRWIFLKKPLVFTWHDEKVDPPLPRNQVNFICDPGISWNEALLAAPSRYTED
jgi:hypothetical protein